MNKDIVTKLQGMANMMDEVSMEIMKKELNSGERSHLESILWQIGANINELMRSIDER